MQRSYRLTGGPHYINPKGGIPIQSYLKYLCNFYSFLILFFSVCIMESCLMCKKIKNPWFRLYRWFVFWNCTSIVAFQGCVLGFYNGLTTPTICMRNEYTYIFVHVLRKLLHNTDSNVEIPASRVNLNTIYYIMTV